MDPDIRQGGRPPLPLSPLCHQLPGSWRVMCQETQVAERGCPHRAGVPGASRCCRSHCKPGPGEAGCRFAEPAGGRPLGLTSSSSGEPGGPQAAPPEEAVWRLRPREGCRLVLAFHRSASSPPSSQAEVFLVWELGELSLEEGFQGLSPGVRL